MKLRDSPSLPFLTLITPPSFLKSMVKLTSRGAIAVTSFETVYPAFALDLA